MKRLVSDISYIKTTEANLQYLIEEHHFKVMHTQNVNTAKFLEAMTLWESGSSDHDPRKVAFNWKNERGLTVQEALTAQESGHWLVIAKPHLGKTFFLDQDDSNFKQGLKNGKYIDRQPPMSKEECEQRTGVDTYFGHVPTPHGYHHVLSEADDPELAGNGAWKIGEYEGDIRCNRGYVVMYNGNILADILRSAHPNAPRTDIKRLIGKQEKPSQPVVVDLDSPPAIPEPHLPCPTIEEIGQALHLSPAGAGTMLGGCFKCKEGATRFHASIKDGKPLFYCFKEGQGTESCNGVNDPATFAKIMEAINNRGDGAAAIAKIHRMVKRAPPESVCAAEMSEIFEKLSDLSDYQKAWIEWKVWNEWYPDAVMQAEIKREKEELAVKHKALLNKGRETKQRAAEEQKQQEAYRQSVKEDMTGFVSVEAPFEKGDVNAFRWCVAKMGRAFRYNVIKMRVEYQEGHNQHWRIIDDHEIDEMFMDISERFHWSDNQKPVHWGRGDQQTMYKGNVYRIKYNPWAEYIEKLPAWDGVQRIHQSMDMGGMTIEESPISAWAQGVAWVDVVRNGLYPGSPRFPEVVLFGPGGKGKSSFLARMLPNDVRSTYFLEGGPSLDADDKTQIEQGAVLLIEGKEFGGGGKKDWEKVKEMWDKATYTARLSYGRTTSTHRRCDTRVHTTNRRQLPEDDTAVNRRLLAVKVTGKVKIEKRRGFQPWDWFDALVDSSVPEKGTYRDQMYAEAVAIIQHHGGAHTIDGRWTCNFNYLEYMAPSISHDPDALLKINQEAGITYATEEGNVRVAGKDALEWYSNAGLVSSLTTLGEEAGGVYGSAGELVAIKPRGLFSMMYQLQAGHDDTTAAKMTAELLKQDLGQTMTGTASANAIDRDSGITLALKRRFKAGITGGDQPLVKEDRNPTAEPFADTEKRFRWFRPVR